MENNDWPGIYSDELTEALERCRKAIDLLRVVGGGFAYSARLATIQSSNNWAKWDTIRAARVELSIQNATMNIEKAIQQLKLMSVTLVDKNGDFGNHVNVGYYGMSEDDRQALNR